MPKIYKSQADRQASRIISALQKAAKGKQSELADVWGISQQGVSYRLSTGRVTLLEIALAKNVLDMDEIREIIAR